jgi:hypothetical protein
MSAEGIVREALTTAGVIMHPSPAFDGFAAENVAVHSVIHQMQSADVSSATCVTALTKMRECPLESRDKQGLGGKLAHEDDR